MFYSGDIIMKNDNETYDVAEEQEIAAIVYNKEEYAAMGRGDGVLEVSLSAQVKSDEARRKYAISFLEKLERKLSELSNQEIANLLRALIASGLPVETEEELEFWLKKLERESLHRIAVYFIARNEGLDKPGSLKMSSNHKKKLLKNIKDFTSEDIEAFAAMMTSVNKIFEKREPANKNGEEYKKFLERKKFFKRVEKLLKQDVQEKKKEERQLQQARQNKRNEEKPDYLGLLKDKMLREGVVQGGNYWGSVIDDFNHAENKGEFVSLWQKDEMRQMALDYLGKELQEQIQKLRGIENLEKQVKETSAETRGKQKSQQADGQQNAAAQQAAQAQASAGR